jgi:DNA end-binding protein Ku
VASTVWKGYITFGLISIPIRLFTAARSERVEMNMLHKVCGSRIKQQLFCPVCERTIERSETIKGYEYSKDRYVTFDADELKKLQPSSAENMEILQFVKTDEVDPIYLETSYYTVPEDPGRKAYKLLFSTMSEAGYSAIAKLTMHQREHIVMIRPYGKGLTLHTVYYPEEVREISEYGQSTEAELRPQEVKLAQALVESLAGPFDPAQYHDEYQVRVKSLIEAKQVGEELPEEQPRKLAPVIDLMEALKASLANTQKKPPTRELKAAEASDEEEARPARKRASGGRRRVAGGS